jgi:hypothetical protein
MQKGYHKLFCNTCNKETWHYQPEIGKIRCCVHVGNLSVGNATVNKTTAYIDVTKEESVELAPESSGVASTAKRIPTKETVAKGFHMLLCDVCNREQWHYKAADDSTAHCLRHSNWNPKHKNRIILAPDVVTGPSDAELRQMNKMDMSLWNRSTEDRNSKVSLAEQDWVSDLFDLADPVTSVDPDKLVCSFCHKEVSNITSNWEDRVNIKKYMDAWADESGEIHMQEKTIASKKRVIACSACVLRLEKPQNVRIV